MHNNTIVVAVDAFVICIVLFGVKTVVIIMQLDKKQNTKVTMNHISIGIAHF